MWSRVPSSSQRKLRSGSSPSEASSAWAIACSSAESSRIIRRATRSWKEAVERYEAIRAEREAKLAENERRALEMAPLKVGADGKEIR